MNYLDTPLFGYYPYICSGGLFIGSLIRSDRDQYREERSRRSCCVPGSSARQQSVSRRCAVSCSWPLFGVLTPHAVYEHFIGPGAKQLIAMVSGGIAGVLAFVGCPYCCIVA